MTLAEEIAPTFPKKMLRDLVKWHRNFGFSNIHLRGKTRIKYTKIALSDIDF